MIVKQHLLRKLSAFTGHNFFIHWLRTGAEKYAIAARQLENLLIWLRLSVSLGSS